MIIESERHLLKLDVACDIKFGNKFHRGEIWFRLFFGGNLALSKRSCTFAKVPIMGIERMIGKGVALLSS